MVPNHPNFNNAERILIECRTKLEKEPLNGRYVFPKIKPLGTWNGWPYFNLRSTTGQGDLWLFFDPRSNSLMYAGGKGEQDFQDLARYAQQQRSSYDLPPKPVSIKKWDGYWCATLLDAQEQAQVNKEKIVGFYTEVVHHYIASH